MNWKAPGGPQSIRWESDLLKWGKSEEQALRREEARGLRRKPIASMWAEVLHSFEYLKSERTDYSDVSDHSRPSPQAD